VPVFSGMRHSGAHMRRTAPTVGGTSFRIASGPKARNTVPAAEATRADLGCGGVMAAPADGAAHAGVSSSHRSRRRAWR
jgi:hypothetical protein